MGRERRKPLTVPFTLGVIKYHPYLINTEYVSFSKCLVSFLGVTFTYPKPSLGRQVKLGYNIGISQSLYFPIFRTYKSSYFIIT